MSKRVWSSKECCLQDGALIRVLRYKEVFHWKDFIFDACSDTLSSEDTHSLYKKEWVHCQQRVSRDKTSAAANKEESSVVTHLFCERYRNMYFFTEQLAKHRSFLARTLGSSRFGCLFLSLETLCIQRLFSACYITCKKSPSRGLCVGTNENNCHLII